MYSYFYVLDPIPNCDHNVTSVYRAHREQNQVQEAYFDRAKLHDFRVILRECLYCGACGTVVQIRYYSNILSGNREFNFPVCRQYVLLANVFLASEGRLSV